VVQLKMSKKNIKKIFKKSVDLRKKILSDKIFVDNIYSSIGLISDCLKNGNKIMIAGNGGSAADAQHFAAELVGKLSFKRKALNCIALTTDTSTLTAVGNDYGFDKIFSRQIEAIGNEGDIFIGISTSGNSKNIIEAVKECKDKKITSLCLLGGKGGKVGQIADYRIVVPSEETSLIQEIHLSIEHVICSFIENEYI
tara:strand:+ start:1729 stop:2319 length:591 start_codon:yes stop_codon:yes gene_type:complete